MSKLLKYENRKSLFYKLVILGVTAVMEIIFLIGVIGKYENPMFIGILGLVFTAVSGIAFIGIESVITLYRDLTTKQSYMLFMTPNSSYKILGAKAIENSFSILLCGVFFGGLAYLDLSLVAKQYDIFGSFTDMVNNFLTALDPRLAITGKAVAAAVFMLICSFILKIITGYLAVVLACTILSGKRGAAIISFVIYVVISILTTVLVQKVPESMEAVSRMMVMALIQLALSVVMYFITAWLMDKKLSV